MVVTGHANGCVRAHVVSEDHSNRKYLEFGVRSITPELNQTYCPPADAPVNADDSVKLLYSGKIALKAQRYVVTAVTEGDRILMMRDHGRAPLVGSSNSRVLHLWQSQRQVRKRDRPSA